MGATANEAPITSVATFLCLPGSEMAWGVCPRDASGGVFMTVLENGRGDWQGFVLSTDATMARIIECVAGSFGSGRDAN